MEAEGVDDSLKKFGRESQERKGRELERVADASRGFLRRETSQKGVCIEGRGVWRHRISSSGGPVPQAAGTRDRGHSPAPQKRAWLLGAEL